MGNTYTPAVARAIYGTREYTTNFCIHSENQLKSSLVLRESLYLIKGRDKTRLNPTLRVVGV